MPSTRIQKAKTRGYSELDLLPGFNMDVKLGDESANPVEREVANGNDGTISHYDTEAFLIIGKFVTRNKIRGFTVKNEIPRHDRIVELMEIFPNETNMRFSKELEYLMSMMHPQINRVLSSAIIVLATEGHCPERPLIIRIAVNILSDLKLK